jgi:hypothetical protein
MRWHSSFNQLRTKGGIAGSELVRRLIVLSQVSFSGSLDVQPSGLKVTVDPSMCRQVKPKFTKAVLGNALAYRSVSFFCAAHDQATGGILTLPHFRAVAICSASKMKNADALRQPSLLRRSLARKYFSELGPLLRQDPCNKSDDYSGLLEPALNSLAFLRSSSALA